MGRMFALATILILAMTGSATHAMAEPATTVVRSMFSSTMQVFVAREGGGRRAGSSIVLAKDVSSGKVILVTAAHVVLPVVPQVIHVTTPVGKVRLLAELLAFDAKADLAILEVGEIEAKPVVLAAQGTLGDQVWVAAFPWGGRISLVGGMVSQIIWHSSDATTEIPLSGPVSQIDASVNHGMSGGGVFDRESGALLGIVRGHRSIQMKLPGEPEKAFTLPVGGETTVVSTLRILCFVTGAGHRELVPERLRALITSERCKADE